MGTVIQIAVPGSPIREDLEAWRGDTFAHDWYFYEDTEAQDPRDMTGITPSMKIREYAAKDAPVILDVPASSFTLVQSDAGVLVGVYDKFRQRITADLMLIDAGLWTYDLELTLPGGMVQTTHFGKFKVKQDRT